LRAEDDEPGGVLGAGVALTVEGPPHGRVQEGLDDGIVDGGRVLEVALGEDRTAVSEAGKDREIHLAAVFVVAFDGDVARSGGGRGVVGLGGGFALFLLNLFSKPQRTAATHHQGKDCSYCCLDVVPRNHCQSHCVLKWR
jgi:hypothetical protein